MNFSDTIEKIVKKEIEKNTNLFLEEKIDETIRQSIGSILEHKFSEHLKRLSGEFEKATVEKWEEFISYRAEAWDHWSEEFNNRTIETMKIIISNLHLVLNSRIQDANNLTICFDKLHECLIQMDKIGHEEETQ